MSPLIWSRIMKVANLHSGQPSSLVVNMGLLLMYIQYIYMLLASFFFLFWWLVCSFHPKRSPWIFARWAVGKSSISLKRFLLSDLCAPYLGRLHGSGLLWSIGLLLRQLVHFCQHHVGDELPVFSLVLTDQRHGGAHGLRHGDDDGSAGDTEWRRGTRELKQMLKGATEMRNSQPLPPLWCSPCRLFHGWLWLRRFSDLRKSRSRCRPTACTCTRHQTHDSREQQYLFIFFFYVSSILPLGVLTC